MAIEIVFSKSDDTPWGFRLTGGADCEIPLTVIKVSKGSIADIAGLEVGHVITKINNRSAEELSHIEAHDVLMDAGQNFIMTVIKDDDFIHDDEMHNEEVRIILQQFSENKHDGHQKSIGMNGDAEETPGTLEALPQPKPTRVHFDDSGSNDLHETQGEMQEPNYKLSPQKKWSTFLQKPNRAVVSPKKKFEEELTGEPYKVIIKKQPKKEAKKVINNEPIEEAPVYSQNTVEALEIIEDDNVADEEEMLEPIDVQEQEDEDVEEDEVEEPQEDFVEDEVYQEDEEVEPEKPASMEEQLAQIQVQLQSLAQVPTSIQDTLEALTEKLAKIVGVPQTQQPSEQVRSFEEYGDDDEEKYSCDDEVLESIIEETPEADEMFDEYRQEATDATDVSEFETDNQTIFENVALPSPEDELRFKLEEEAERERQQLEYEKSLKNERTEEFHQRRLEQRPTIPLAPVQRPIVLPGGRKWTEPDDALPKPRKSKMTDEKICETLDNYSEIVAGHTKGINFLKYQPAPKNLDYLQRSEVFRLVHDMDPPKSGIAARSGLIVSEEDYYKNPVSQPATLRV